jgi:hypothetical protein
MSANVWCIVTDEQAAEIAAIGGIPDQATFILLRLAEKVGIYEGARDHMESDDPARIILNAYRSAAREMYDTALAAARGEIL